MKKVFFIALLLSISTLVQAQDILNDSNLAENSAEKLLAKDQKLLIGGYGEVHYNQAIKESRLSNGELDVHRIVMLFGYSFNKKTKFITELEFEHVKEVYVEQAFIQYKINRFLNLRGGLMLVPMGIINEYHEPTSFHGVERPLIEKYLTPTTWREIGFGLSGNITPLSIKYQAYLMNGISGYDGEGKLNGKNGIRGGRQKGSESSISSPSIAARIGFYGLKGLNLGFSGFWGKTQSTLYNDIKRKDIASMAIADSSTVGLSMIGIDSRFIHKGLVLKGQLYYTGITNSKEYNTFNADENGTLNDLGSSMLGYYAEAGYNVLQITNSNSKLIPFIRYEYLNTHKTVENSIERNPQYQKDMITAGISFVLTRGAVLKADIQFLKDKSSSIYEKTFNAGFGVMF